MSLQLIPINQATAFAFIREHHRHHNVPVGAMEVFGAADNDGQLVGAAVVGRPVARALDDGLTFEICKTFSKTTACPLAPATPDSGRGG